MDPVTLVVTALAAGASTTLHGGVSAAQMMRLVDEAGEHQIVVHASQSVQVRGPQHPAEQLCPAWAR